VSSVDQPPVRFTGYAAYSAVPNMWSIDCAASSEAQVRILLDAVGNTNGRLPPVPVYQFDAVFGPRSPSAFSGFVVEDPNTGLPSPDTCGTTREIAIARAVALLDPVSPDDLVAHPFTAFT
jgi:hypothetical protein